MTPWLDDGDLKLYHGNCLDVLRGLPDRSVHMCATSPPFYGLRDYGTGRWEGGDPDCDHQPDRKPRETRTRSGLTGGTATIDAQDAGVGAFRDVCGKCGARRVDRQIGLEESPDQWVERLVEVFREVRRVLRDDGTLWVEIGDSFASSQASDNRTAEERSKSSTLGPKRNGLGANNAAHVAVSFEPRKLRTGLKQKDLLGQPWMLAKALRDPYYTGKIKSEADRVWLAAMLDAEGSIGIHKRPAGSSAHSSYEKKDGTTSEYVRKTDSYQPKVEITNTSRAIMDRVVAIAGGNCDTKQEAGTHGRKQTIYRWTVTADKARDLLRELYPHLVGKQHEARLAYGCPSSGDGASEAHESLKALHRGDAASIDFAAPETMWEAGWFLRSEIIWARQRPNPMPESVTDRPTKAHSTIFLLSKQPRYFYDADAIREAFNPDSAKGQRTTSHYDTAERYGAGNGGNGGLDGMAARMRVAVPPPQSETLGDLPPEAPRGPDGRRQTGVKGGENSEQHRDGERWPNPAGANARSVWTVPTEPTPFAHFATWPQKLVARMVKAGTSEKGCCPECGAPWERITEREVTNPGNRSNNGRYDGSEVKRRGFEARRETEITTLGWRPSCSHDQPPVPCTVLDIFAGSGTTLKVARDHGRHSVGIELNEAYLRIAADRLAQQSLLTGDAA